jgi:hypothetical protein
MHEAHVARLKAKGKGGGGEEGGEGSEQSKLKVSFPLLRGLHARRVDALRRAVAQKPLSDLAIGTYSRAGPGLLLGSRIGELVVACSAR